jgi:hypothetical protein
MLSNSDRGAGPRILQCKISRLDSNVSFLFWCNQSSNLGHELGQPRPSWLFIDLDLVACFEQRIFGRVLRLMALLMGVQEHFFIQGHATLANIFYLTYLVKLSNKVRLSFSSRLLSTCSINRSVEYASFGPHTQS